MLSLQPKPPQLWLQAVVQAGMYVLRAQQCQQPL